MKVQITSHPKEGSIRAQKTRNDTPPLILVVDKNHASRQFWTAELFLSGYEVDDVANCSEAWDDLKDDRYDLLFAENKMPEGSGFQMIRELRESQMNLPVILATSIAVKDDFEADLSPKSAVTQIKSYSTEELLKAVHQVLMTAIDRPRQTENARQLLSKPSDAVY